MLIFKMDLYLWAQRGEVFWWWWWFRWCWWRWIWKPVFFSRSSWQLLWSINLLFSCLLTIPACTATCTMIPLSHFLSVSSLLWFDACRLQRTNSAIPERKDRITLVQSIFYRRHRRCCGGIRIVYEGRRRPIVDNMSTALSITSRVIEKSSTLT